VKGRVIVILIVLVVVAIVLYKKRASSNGGPEPAPASTSSRGPGESLLNAPTDYLKAVVGAPGRTRRKTDLIQVQSEIRMYQAEKGRYPSSLEELAQWRGLAVPPPPRGYSYEYNPQTGELSLKRSM